MSACEHKYCPECGFHLEGGLIFETFLEKYGDREKARVAARLYGATETEGRWGKAIGIYDMERDMTVEWMCPECRHTWKR